MDMCAKGLYLLVTLLTLTQCAPLSPSPLAQ